MNKYLYMPRINKKYIYIFYITFCVPYYWLRRRNKMGHQLSLNVREIPKHP